MKSRSHAPSPGVWTLVIVLGLLVLWEVAAAGGHVNEFFFSRPSLLWQEFVDMVSSGLLARHLSTTGQEAGLGLLFGGVLGTLAGENKSCFSHVPTFLISPNILINKVFI